MNEDRNIMAVPRVPVNTDISEGWCFGCGRNNPFGLKLSFRCNGKEVVADIIPGEYYQGWHGVVHGGIIVSMLDEAMAYAVHFAGKNCLTAEMDIKFKCLALVGEPLVITASITKITRRLIKARAKVCLQDGTMVAEGTGTQFVIEGDSGDVKMGRSSAKPENRLKAVIWDMDGVIADTAIYHFKAWHETFRQIGVDFTADDFKRVFGQRNDTIVSNYIGRDISPGELSAIASEKEENYRQEVAPNVKPLPGAVELIKALNECGVEMAIASSAPMENILLILGSLGIKDYFKAIVWGGEVTEGKPSPQGFLLAAAKLGVVPETCVVIEDAVAGVAAAKRAGMKCLAVTNTHPEVNLKEADRVVGTLEEVAVSGLEVLFGL